MTKDLIVVDHYPFAQESRIFVVQNGEKTISGVASEIQKLAQQVVNTAHEYNIMEVQVHAPLAAINEIRRIIKEQDKNIKVEGI